LVDSVFYGACAENSNSYIYRIRPDGTEFKIILTFPLINGWEEIIPRNILTFCNGNLFGMTKDQSLIFKVGIDGTCFNVIHNFNQQEGIYPFGSLFSMKNNLYGMAGQGGTYGYGTIFKYNIVAMPPKNQSSNNKISDLVCDQMKISWTRGNGSNSAVFVREDSSEFFPVVDSSKYIANSVFGMGGQIDSSGWFCVYNGTDSAVTVTGLKPVTNYQFMVSEYNVALQGDERYNTNKSIDNPVIVKTIKCSQSIFFDLLPIETFGDIGFGLEAEASSGLKINYYSDKTKVANIRNDSAIILESGSVNIIASQPGDSIYYAAESVSRKLTVLPAVAIEEEKLVKIKIYPNPVHKYLFFEKSNQNSYHIKISDLLGKIIIDKLINEDRIDVSSLHKGLYILRINDTCYRLEKL
jgi:uncharacterized repeat protein (TIGR03803 family)